MKKYIKSTFVYILFALALFPFSVMGELCTEYVDLSRCTLKLDVGVAKSGLVEDFLSGKTRSINCPKMEKVIDIQNGTWAFGNKLYRYTAEEIKAILTWKQMKKNHKSAVRAGQSLVSSNNFTVEVTKRTRDETVQKLALTNYGKKIKVQAEFPSCKDVGASEIVDVLAEKFKDENYPNAPEQMAIVNDFIDTLAKGKCPDFENRKFGSYKTYSSRTLDKAFFHNDFFNDVGRFGNFSKTPATDGNGSAFTQSTDLSRSQFQNNLVTELNKHLEKRKLDIKIELREAKKGEYFHSHGHYLVVHDKRYAGPVHLAIFKGRPSNKSLEKENTRVICGDPNADRRISDFSELVDPNGKIASESLVVGANSLFSSESSSSGGAKPAGADR